ncbi:MAG TPA: cytochrome c-type biogenesis CcmF C-terminal domain-containing protein [Acidimicrobiia bacterium]
MSAGVIGPVAVWAAISFAIIALTTGRRWALIASAVTSGAAAVVIVVALLASDFSLAYVAETTSLATPWPYRLAALWGGMDGSMLFYTTLTLTVAAGALKERIVVRAAAAVGFGLLLVTVFFANPFTLLTLPAVDGVGLLAILQHPAMIYHPPVLYLGLTTLVVPFALTTAMTIRRGDRAVWMARTRRWLYVSWTLLTFGMVAGANWAYVELGWGGYWAWDPVENTALMPWLAVTVFLHTSRIEETTGRIRRWNVMFASLPFALTVLGVYLTRSGATGSIHSFAEDPVVGRILLITAAVAILLVFLLAVRSEPGETWGPVRFDRDGWLSVNALLLTAALVFISAGSAYPAFVSVFLGRSASVDSRFFVMTVLPIAIAVATGLTVGLLRRWQAFAIATAVAAVVGVAVTGPRVGVVLFAPAAGSLAAIAKSVIRRRVRGRLLTVYLAHAGMAVFLLAVAASSLGSDFNGSMRPGDTVELGGHDLTLRSIETGNEDRYIFVRADFDLDGSFIAPQIRAYEDQDVPVAEPALRSTLLDDVIVAVSLMFPDGETIEVSAFVRPLVMWVWVGAGLMGLAGLAALFARDGAAAERRRLAREGRRRAGTTSGSVAR